VEETVEHPIRTASGSDAAVNGLFGGWLGGLAMAGAIAGGSLLAGQGLAYLGYFATSAPVSPLLGLLGHMGVSGVYGLLYGLLRHWIGVDRLRRVPGWLVGLVYAFGLWALAVTVLLPAAGSLMLTQAWPVFFVGHVAYGLVLGARQKA
jgi:hypothetical protein